ncbi:protein YIPF6 [Galendromus occidentalis]|uniref:Protein YIPF n=1 Tax=Galendromus occidentalis TaxID=34638 RepID=A0AAJ6W0C6_9ACAR|nr:protein YIPF6 [Galendromus occidentalis]
MSLVDLESPSTVIDGLTPQGPDEWATLNTLDEPIMTTVMRDARSIVNKFVNVYTPKKQKQLLRDWDLWGPLMICVVLAVILQTSAGSSNSEAVPHFAELFVMVWGGAALVTLNTILMGSQLSFFQGLCVLGYCLLGQCISLIVCKALPAIIGNKMALFLVTVSATMLGCVWSIVAASGTFSGLYEDHRTILVRYPIVIYYLLISWLILSWSNPHC